MPIEAQATATTTRRRWLRRAALVLGAVAMLAVPVGLLGLRIARSFLVTEPFPESATGLRPVLQSRAASAMVVSADAQASRAAWNLLAKGGSAMDAVIAAQLVLGLVEPQSSGVGGGGFLLYWDAQQAKLFAYDGRETAPAAIDKDVFMLQGQPLSFPRALVGGRAAGVPGIVRMLALAHARHARLPWPAATVDARRLAADGFRVSPRLSKLIGRDPVLPTLAAARSLLLPSGRPPAPGSRLVNTAYASMLGTLAKRGPDAFYQGHIAQRIAATVRSARQPSLLRGLWNLGLLELGLRAGGRARHPAPGVLSPEDLAQYRALERSPICLPYRSYRVCTMPPPAAGLSVLQSLAFLERFPLSSYAPLAPESLHLLAEAQRLAFADRDAYLADPAFSRVPVAGLLDTTYLQRRSERLSSERVLAPGQALTPGHPRGVETTIDAASSFELPSTSHVSIVDRDGNIACLTSSIEFAFGSHLMVDGFLLNNQLTDFSFRPEQDGRPVANAVAPGKRPRSAMSPTVIFDADSGKPVAALGSPGGPNIIGYVLQTIVALLDWKLAPQAAVALPHVIQRNHGTTELEDVGWPSSEARDAARRGLEARGHTVELGQQTSGLHVVVLDPAGWAAGVDPRREGAAIGDD
jgi:gamma-glutamyltranspeptidase / glutathione hydrolase